MQKLRRISELLCNACNESLVNWLENTRSFNGSSFFCAGSVPLYISENRWSSRHAPREITTRKLVSVLVPVQGATTRCNAAAEKGYCKVFQWVAGSCRSNRCFLSPARLPIPPSRHEGYSIVEAWHERQTGYRWTVSRASDTFDGRIICGLDDGFVELVHGQMPQFQAWSVFSSGKNLPPSLTVSIASTRSRTTSILEMKPRAPICCASHALCLSALTVTITTLESGKDLNIFCAASNPFIWGMPTSRRITSGRNWVALPTASRPSTASPSTSHPSWLDRRLRIPLRTASWSSAISIFKHDIKRRGPFSQDRQRFFTWNRSAKGDPARNIGSFKSGDATRI
jgi:hypothetical protein